MKAPSLARSLVLACLTAAAPQAPPVKEAQQIPDQVIVAKATDHLRAIIQKQQRLNVCKSYGEWAQECFTWVDLNEFRRTGKLAQIAQALKGLKEIAQIVSSLEALPMSQRDSLPRTYRQPLRKTWAQLGRISPEGQTEAGQQAEMLIANAIVDMVRNHLGHPSTGAAGRQ